jgi:hypothetical protein
VNKISVEKLHEMLYTVARLGTRIPAVFVQYGRNAPVLQFSKAANHSTDAVAGSCVHQQHGLKLGVQQPLHDVKCLPVK